MRLNRRGRNSEAALKPTIVPPGKVMGPAEAPLDEALLCGPLTQGFPLQWRGLGLDRLLLLGDRWEADIRSRFAFSWSVAELGLPVPAVQV